MAFPLTAVRLLLAYTPTQVAEFWVAKVVERVLR
jgi:hypothetical protein